MGCVLGTAGLSCVYLKVKVPVLFIFFLMMN